MADTNAILSPVMLWKDFNDKLPLKESTMSENVFDDVVYSEVYFSGRETPDGRVRIFGVYARNKKLTKRTPRGAVLIIPDITETINLEIVKLYVKEGYAVLMLDCRGEFEGTENFTKYPASIDYANYKKAGRAMEYADKTAKETSWYEWVAVAKYGVTFLANRAETDRIGVIGIKNGANIGWPLCATDTRVNCFVALYGAGWMSYKGNNKYSGTDILMTDERLRFLAGVDSHSYAQYIKCPVLYLTATNSPDFDIDRAVDTLYRIDPALESMQNYAPNFRDVIDKYGKRDVDLFLAKYLLGFKIDIPTAPKLELTVENRRINAELEIDFSETRRTKSVNVYLSEDGENPAFREWRAMKAIKGKYENKKSFVLNIYGNCNFVYAFGVVEYKNGLTISSKIVRKTTPYINTRADKIIYAAKDEDHHGFSLCGLEKHALGGIFFEEDTTNTSAAGEKGVGGKYPVISYRVNNRRYDISERSLIMFDVFTKEYAAVLLTFTVLDDECKTTDYSVRIEVKGMEMWQNKMIKCTDFKSFNRISIKDYTKIVALRIESDAACSFNNILLL